MRQKRFYAPPKELPLVHRVMEGDNFLRTVFAPDPKTGWPASDFQVLVSDKTQPEVAEYIRSKLQSVQQPLPKGDADTVMSAMRNAYEDTEAYMKRLQEFSYEALHENDVNDENT